MLGFIGLGNMGGHMARNLLNAQKMVMVFDVVPAAVQELKSAGAKVAQSPSEISANCQQIITMLPSSPHVTEVYTGKNGIFSSIQKSTLCIDSSTIEPSVSKQINDLAVGHGCHYLDAPVSGGVLAAQNAGLTFMVGGDSGAFEQAEPILKLMGQKVVHCGASGNGQAVKICNNMLLAISMIGVSETYNLGEKLGLDPKLLASIINSATGRCWSSDTYNPVPGVIEGVPSSKNYEGGFGTALMAKDLGLAQNASTSVQAPTPLGSLAHQIYRQMCISGLDKKDFSVAYQFLKNAGKF